VSTWRDGVLLSRQEKAELSSEQPRQYLDELAPDGAVELVTITIDSADLPW
jgi:hypothetical protein